MLGVVVVLVAVGSLDLELFFVLSFVGFLAIVQLTSPAVVRPAWRRRLPWFVAAGLLAFGYVVVRRVLEIVPLGVFG